MKKKIITQVLLILICAFCKSQDIAPKEKAEALAKNEFSKTKHKKVEKFGVVKELNKVIVSTPVINNKLSFYDGNYFYQDLNYKIEVRTDKYNKPMATLTIAGGKDILLQEVSIFDAFFHAVKLNADGSKELWEGAFINKNDNGHTEFGLGIKLSKPIQLTEGLNITKIFLKKVSP